MFLIDSLGSDRTQILVGASFCKGVKKLHIEEFLRNVSASLGLSNYLTGQAQTICSADLAEQISPVASRQELSTFRWISTTLLMP